MSSKTKIAVLGGGISSLSTLFHLTSKPDWKEKYDITLYQLGWRLGGKCASSRNEKEAMRIEEHGLHLWFGFYDQAFSMMRQCFEEYNMPQTSLETAFTGYDYIALQEQIGPAWQTWMNYCPPNGLEIGEIYNTPIAGVDNIYNYIKYLIDFLRKQHTVHYPSVHPDLKASLKISSSHLLYHATPYPELYSYLQEHLDPTIGSHEVLDFFLRHAESLVAKLDGPDGDKHSTLFLNLLDHLLKILWDILKSWIQANSTALRLWISVEFFVTSLKGFYNDDVVHKGFKAINAYDLRIWLHKNGASDLTVDSGLVQAIYGLVFGGKDQYTFEAGTAMEGFMKMALLYKGHIYYRMNNGMGDIIIGPLYHVLKNRGVKFEFFRKVTHIVPDQDGTSIKEVHMDVQATLKDGYKEYEPMCTDPNLALPYWPSHPRYEFLEQTDLEGVNLESYYTNWQPVGQHTLVKDKDFDLLIQGISIGALPYIAKDILDREERADWRDMVANIKPVPTIASQLWLLPNISQMGWPYANDGLALLGSYQEPYDTWADMSHLIDKEQWPTTQQPQNIAYIVGPTPQKFATMAPFTDHDFPAKQHTMAKQFAYEYLQKLAGNIWPNTINNETQNFDWTALASLENEAGKTRFDSQYFKANIDPTELYVLSVQDSSRYRLKTNQTGFHNMFITGDWIDIGFNAGCVECSVAAGILTASAIHAKYPDIKSLEESNTISENATI